MCKAEAWRIDRWSSPGQSAQPPHPPPRRYAVCFDSDSVPPIAGDPTAVVRRESRTLTAADGAVFLAFMARPQTSTDVGVVVMPDVRGLYRFYRELAVRFAESGHSAVAIDYFGRTAGIGERDQDFPFMDHIVQTTRAGVQADVDAAAAYLRSPEGGSCRAVFTIGFCFGGRRSFVAAAIARDLTGVIGFYGGLGPGPDGPGPTALVESMSVPVLGVFSGTDDAIPPTDVSEFERALADARVGHEVITYPEAPHSFFDRRHDEYADASADAWRRVLAFIDRHGSRKGL